MFFACAMHGPTPLAACRPSSWTLRGVGDLKAAAAVSHDASFGWERIAANVVGAALSEAASLQNKDLDLRRAALGAPWSGVTSPAICRQTRVIKAAERRS
jgi:hypothetical protein